MGQLNTHRLAGAACALALLLATGGIRLAEAQSATAPSVVTAVSPYRILDTRLGTGTGGVVARVGQGSTITLSVAGVGPVPPNATGVVLNLTGTNASAATYVSAWPSGENRPDTSVLNITPGVDSPNMVTAALGADGRLNLFNAYGNVDVIADVAGYLLPAGTAGGTPGPQGPQGPQGPAGDPGVITGTATLTWSAGTTTAWFTYSGSTSTGWTARTATVAVPQLTQAIIDRGTVDVVFKPDSAVQRWTPLPYSQATNFGWSRVIEYRYEVGQITMYWTHQSTQTGVTPPSIGSATPPNAEVRWSLRPG